MTEAFPSLKYDADALLFFFAIGFVVNRTIINTVGSEVGIEMKRDDC